MPAVVLAATGLMAIVGMGSVAVAAAGWSTTTEVSVDGVTMTPSAAAPQIGVAVQTTAGPGGAPVAAVVLSPLPGTPLVLSPVPVASLGTIESGAVSVTLSGTPMVILPAPTSPEPVSEPTPVPPSASDPSPSPLPPVETTSSPSPFPSPLPPTEAASTPSPSPVP